MNSFDLLDPRLFDVPLALPSGYPEAMAAGDTTDVLWDVCGSASREFSDDLWIDPKDWDDWARENDKHNTWPRNYSDRFTNQDPSHECVYHSAVAGWECCWNRQRGIIYVDGAVKGLRNPDSARFHSIWLSPLSGYSPVNPNRWGGSNVRGSLERLTRYGLLPDKIQPRDYGFKHVLQGTSGRGCNNQSGGGWIRERDFPEGWEETARHFRVLEAIFPRSWEQLVCLVLRGMMVHVGRRGHAVPYCRWLPGQGMEYKDSYEVYRYDSISTVKSAWQGSYAIASVTTPDCWDKPASLAVAA